MMMLFILLFLSACNSHIDFDLSESQSPGPVNNCPSGFIPVYGNGSLGTLDFCVMQYEAKQNSTTPISQPQNKPWVSLTAGSAYSACDSLNSSQYDGVFGLISNPEWMTIARDIENTSSNWSGGSIGIGHIPRGHSDNSPTTSQSIANPQDPYTGTGNNASQLPGSGWEQKRTHYLSSGFTLWDFAGNVWEWTDWDPTLAGFTLGPNDENTTWKEFSDPIVGATLSVDDYLPNAPSLDSLNNSVGKWSGGGGGVTRRGGFYNNDEISGIYALYLIDNTSVTSTNIGFRCVYRP